MAPSFALGVVVSLVLSVLACAECGPRPAQAVPAALPADQEVVGRFMEHTSPCNQNQNKSSPCGIRPVLPVDPEVVGKIMGQTGPCNRNKTSSGGLLRIDNASIHWEPDFSWESPNVCPERISALFSKKDKPSVIQWTPAISEANYKKRYPYIYEKHRSVILRTGAPYQGLPCSHILPEKIAVWGPRREAFISLVKRTIVGIKRSRDMDCNPETGLPTGSPITANDVSRILSRHLVANNALGFLYNLAYSNFFSECVQDH